LECIAVVRKFSDLFFPVASLRGSLVLGESKGWASCPFFTVYQPGALFPLHFPPLWSFNLPWWGLHHQGLRRKEGVQRERDKEGGRRADPARIVLSMCDSHDLTVDAMEPIGF